MREEAGDHGVAWQPQRLSSMTLTSGSTGLPKAAVHTCQAHLASAEGVLSLIPFGKDDDWLLSLPLFHVSGQGILWRWLFAGARMTVREKQPLEQMLAGCTHASLVPTQLWRLLMNQTPVSLKAVLLGGAAIPVALTEQARAQGIRCWCGYGLTEFASTVCAKEADGQADVGGRYRDAKSTLLMTKCGCVRRAWRQVTGETADWRRWLTTKDGLLHAIAVCCLIIN